MCFQYDTYSYSIRGWGITTYICMKQWCKCNDTCSYQLTEVPAKQIFAVRLFYSILFHSHVQNATIPCRSQELFPFLSVICSFLPLFSINYSSVFPPFIVSSIFWFTCWSCCFHIHIQYSFGNSIFFRSLYMCKATICVTLLSLLW
jgi:hypothetical protein